MNKNQIKELAEHHLSQHLPYYKFKFNKRISSLGMCNYGTKVISLSLDWALACSDEEVKDTILHEIAHGLAWEKHQHRGHGAIWKKYAEMLGARPEATAKNADTPKVHEVRKPKFHVMYGDEIVHSYYRKPSRDFTSSWVKGRPETKGKLKVVAVDAPSAPETQDCPQIKALYDSGLRNIPFIRHCKCCKRRDKNWHINTQSWLWEHDCGHQEK